MRRRHAIILAFCLSASAARGQAPRPTPADLKITWAEKSIQAAPGKYQAYNQLAWGLLRKVRESSNPAYVARAEEAFHKSLRLNPGNFEALKIQVTILLVRQEYAPALEQARALNRRAPDDVAIWGYIAEAARGLGDYDAAEKAAQWMLDLRPGNAPGLIEGAGLRKLYGDIDGARDFLNQAYQQTPPNEVEDAAWLLTEMADLERGSGRLDGAEKLLAGAQSIFPGYYRTLEGLARVRITRHEYAAAVDLLHRRNQSFPTLGSEYALAMALTQAERASEAASVFAHFESEARSRMQTADNDNRDLVLYYADQAHRPDEALRIARLEASRRHDVLTLDALAWALCASGQYAEADTQMNRALAVGIRDGEMYYHAGQIAAKLGHATQAAGYLKQARDLGALPEESKSAEKTRAGVETTVGVEATASRGASTR